MWGLPLSAGPLTICHIIGQLWTHCAPSVLPRPPASSGHHEQWSSAALWQVFVDVYTEPLPVDIDKFRHEETMIDAPSMYNCLLTFLTGPEDSTVALSLPPRSSSHQCLHSELFGSDNAWGLSFARRFGRVYNELRGLGSPPSLSLSLSLSLSHRLLYGLLVAARNSRHHCLHSGLFGSDNAWGSSLPVGTGVLIISSDDFCVFIVQRHLLRLYPINAFSGASWILFILFTSSIIPPKNPNIYNHYNKIINILMSFQILEEHYWYQGIFPWDFGHL